MIIILYVFGINEIPQPQLLAREKLGWKLNYDLDALIDDMMK